MPLDAFVAATPTLPSARACADLATRLRVAGRAPPLQRAAPLRAALRVGARNGDSRAPDRGVHRRPRVDQRPLLATMPGMHPDAPPKYTKAAQRRYDAEVAALREAAEKERADMHPDRLWGGAVCGGPAAHLIERLRAMWLGRAEMDEEKLEPLTDSLVRLVGRLVKEIRACDEAYYGDDPAKRVPDEEYDELVMHLAELERVYPALVTPDSPTQTVGHAASMAAARGVNILTPVTLASVMAQRFPPHRHVTRMLSLASAYTPEDVTAFLVRAAKLEKELLAEERERAGLGSPAEAEGESEGVVAVEAPTPSLCVEVKVDGVALALSYRHGKLVTAATRGDGVVGDDVTENVRGALVGRGVPAELPENLHVDIRGEVYISPDEFASLQDDDQGRLANARNAAAGGLKNKDPKEAAKRLLRFVGYDCLRIADELVGLEDDQKESAARAELDDESRNASKPLVVNHWSTQVETLEGLAEWGVGGMTDYQLCHTEKDINYFATATESKRKALPFEADGVVIKVNDSHVRQALGSTAKSPRGAVALKFHSLGAETVLESVVMQVSRTGVVTPVALLRPVSIGGVTVSRATLHNFDEIERLGVAVNDSILVLRGGDVIPKVKAVKARASDAERRPIEIPDICPSCKSPLKVTRNEASATVVSCQNADMCSAQGLGRLLHFCRRDAMDIQGLGAKTAQRLLDSSLVANPSDLFTLSLERLEDLEGFQKTSASNLYSAIQAAAGERSLERLIIGLGIPGVGRASARALALHAGTIEGLVQLTEEGVQHLMLLPNVAEKSAESIYSFLIEPRVQGELASLDHLLVFKSAVDDEGPADPFMPSTSSSPLAGEESRASLAGKSFAFTGKLEGMARPLAMKRIRALGGKTVSAVSKKTNFVVVGSDPGLKYQKAMRCGCRILAVEDLAKVLDDAEAQNSFRAASTESTKLDE